MAEQQRKQRDSDASDASNSHLGVYDSAQERKSSISFDKIKQFSLTYSLQSEDDEAQQQAYDIVPKIVHSSNGTQPVDITIKRTTTDDEQVHDVLSEAAPPPPPINGNTDDATLLKSLEDQLRLVNERINYSGNSSKTSSNPFEVGVDECEFTSGGQRRPKSPQTMSNEQQQQQQSVSIGTNSTISLKLAKNMSANIIINSASSPTEAVGMRAAPDEHLTRNDYVTAELSSDNSSCWDCGGGGGGGASVLLAGSQTDAPLSLRTKERRRKLKSDDYVTAAAADEHEPAANGRATRALDAPEALIKPSARRHEWTTTGGAFQRDSNVPRPSHMIDDDDDDDDQEEDDDDEDDQHAEAQELATNQVRISRSALVGGGGELPAQLINGRPATPVVQRRRADQEPDIRFISGGAANHSRVVELGAPEVYQQPRQRLTAKYSAPTMCWPAAGASQQYTTSPPPMSRATSRQPQLSNSQYASQHYWDQQRRVRHQQQQQQQQPHYYPHNLPRPNLNVAGGVKYVQRRHRTTHSDSPPSSSYVTAPQELARNSSYFTSTCPVAPPPSSSSSFRHNQQQVTGGVGSSWQHEQLRPSVSLQNSPKLTRRAQGHRGAHRGVGQVRGSWQELRASSHIASGTSEFDDDDADDEEVEFFDTQRDDQDEPIECFRLPNGEISITIGRRRRNSRYQQRGLRRTSGQPGGDWPPAPLPPPPPSESIFSRQHDDYAMRGDTYCERSGARLHNASSEQLQHQYCPADGSISSLESPLIPDDNKQTARHWKRRPTGPFVAVATGGNESQSAAQGVNLAAAAAATTHETTTTLTEPKVNPLAGGVAQEAPVPTAQTKPVKLRNLLTNETASDHLHLKYKTNTRSHGCTETRCLGSIINPKPVEARVRTASETWEQARDFIDGYYTSIKRLDTPAHKNRLVEIEEQIKSTDTYYLRETELIYGAKLAWRNAPRCIGRIQWSKLQVFDARFTRNAQEMFEAICNHIKYATNKGSLRSAITIFPQRVKSCDNDWRVWNSQLVGYAGYRNEQTGQLLGDPINADFTEICLKLGWPGGQPQRTQFDVLPIVLSANGGSPQLFVLPDELVLRVQLKHPQLDWFAELGLQWYALPAVSGMMLDVGGLQFTACPFSGWYMVTEIGARDLGDANRYNVLESIAQRLGLNTQSNLSLWRDQALTQLNLAVLDSFQTAGVTIVDHHTACETFMTHLKNEQRLRGGCPADWVWLVPPTAGSTTQVYHQEMVSYHLLPNYEYLAAPWRSYDWVAWEKREAVQKASEPTSTSTSAQSKLVSALLGKVKPVTPPKQSVNGSAGGGGPAELTPRHLRFKEIARAVKFTSKLFGKALSRRIKATILYATETGKSERFANKLAQIFSHAFNVHLMSMSDYDMTCLEHEALLLIVTSTFGNGDPPENGELFAKHLAAIKMTGDSSPDLDSINSVSTNPFFQMLSEDHKDGLNQAAAAAAAAAEAKKSGSAANSSSSGRGTGDSDGTDSNDELPVSPPTHSGGGSRGHHHHLTTGSSHASLNQERETNIRPLSNVRFAVFALGSTAYPHFCAFGRYVDQTLGELGAERIQRCACGDELCGQEKAFNEWSSQVFKIACDVFCLTDTMEPLEERPETLWSPRDVKFVYDDEEEKSNCTIASRATIIQNLVGIVGKKIVPFSVKRRRDLHAHNAQDEHDLRTICVDLGEVASNAPISFKAGDHVGIYPINKQQVVDNLIERIQAADLASESSKHHMDRRVSILIKRGNLENPLAAQPDEWIQCDTLPVTSLREALTRYLDITNPPNQDFLSILARQTSDQEERKRLTQLARNFTMYEEWKNKRVPSLSSVLDEFKTVKFHPALITQIPPMKPRFYSISGTSISLTLGVVRYRTREGELREGLCSNYLNTVPVLDDSSIKSSYVYGYVRSAAAFHMPQDKSVPMLLISAGTGIAPFRAFWQQRQTDMTMTSEQQQQQQRLSFGKMELYFGCRNSRYILYAHELDQMHAEGVLSSVNIAFSRPLDVDVQLLATAENGHIVNNNNNNNTINKSIVASVRQERKKMYVQDKLFENGSQVFELIMFQGAHIYVCGDVAMADGVYKTLAKILNNCIKANKLTDSQHQVDNSPSCRDLLKSGQDGESILMNLRNNNRYHEDIFGAKQA